MIVTATHGSWTEDITAPPRNDETMSALGLLKWHRATFQQAAPRTSDQVRHHQPATAYQAAGLLPLSGHSGHGRNCRKLDPVANDPYRKLSILHGGRLSAEATLFSWLWNHSPLLNFVSDRIFAPGADGTWRLYPSVSHGTLNILPLEPSASWAGKRSQILAGVTRLNGREPHW